MFFQKTGQVFEVGKPARNGRETPDHFSYRLLHRLDFGLHDGNIVRGKIARQLSFPARFNF